MINYNSSDVVQCLRQYDMFANSLRLIRNIDEKNMIVKQLTKLEHKIIDLTNEAYLEEYNTLKDKKCGLLDEEKNRLNMLIELINQRLSYIEKRCNSHYQLTGESLDAPEVEGASLLDELEDRVKIIEKYSKNVKLQKELEDEIKSLTNKITLASEKMDINKSLNNELEVTFKKTLTDAFTELNLYELEDIKDQLEYAYYETEKSLALAKSNYEVAKTSPANILSDCKDMLDDILNDYYNYKDKISIFKLMDICNLEVNDYEELLNKRKEVNEILKYVRNQELLGLIIDTVDKQFNTITLEEQDINTFNDLVVEKDRKLDALKEINDENNSDKFQSVLKELIENERKRQEKILEEQRRIEEIEKQKRLEIERKRQEEILRRQKIIEEARKKEIEKRTKQMLEEQQNSVLQGKKKEIKEEVKEEIEDIPNIDKVEEIPRREDRLTDVYIEEPVKEETPKEEVHEKEVRFDLNSLKSILQENKIEDDDVVEETPVSKNKDSIERELFDEFKSNETTENKYQTDEDINDLYNRIDDKLSNKDDDEMTFADKISNTKFPDMSLDEYMNNFNEDNIKTNDLFDDSSFPSIPM